MNKRIMKVITLILSCLLLIGAAVGITVAAEENSDYYVEIYKKNVAYEGKVQIVYLVDTNYEGGTVMIDFGGYKKAAQGEFTLDDQTFDVVYSNGIAAKDYKKTITATPYVVDAEGNTVATGASVKFSPVAYVLDRLNGEKAPTEKQRTLLDALLDYGAAVQKVLGDTGSLANDYEMITFNAAGGESDAASMYVATGVPYTLPNAYTDDFALISWATADGKYLPINGIWPEDVSGELTAKWGVEAANFVDFDNGTPLEKYFYDGTGKIIYKDGVAKMVSGANSVGTAVKPVANITAPAAGMKYAWEFTVTYNGSDYTGISATSNQFGWFGFFKTGIGDNGKLAHTSGWDLIWVSDGDEDGNYDSIIFRNGGSQINIPLGETKTIRYEYVLGDRCDVFVNGEYAFQAGGTSLFNLMGAGIAWRNPVYNYNSFDIDFDDMSLSVMTPATDAISVELNAKGGLLSTEEDGNIVNKEVVDYNVYVGGEYELPVPARDGKVFGGWYNGTTLVPNTGAWTYGEGVTLTAKWFEVVRETVETFTDGAYNTEVLGVPNHTKKILTDEGTLIFNPDTSQGRLDTFFADDDVYADVVAGDRYVYEIDLWYRGAHTTYENSDGSIATVKATDSSGIGWVGYRVKDGNTSQNALLYYLVMKFGNDVDGDGIFDSLNIGWAKIALDTKATIKFVYTVQGNNTAGRTEMYINDVYMGVWSSGRHNKTTELIQSFNFNFRSKAYCGDLVLEVDNIRLAVEKAVVDAQ